MISSKDFPRVNYTEPRLDDDRPKIDNIIGIDSEAYVSGEPFMLCTSRGEFFDPKDSPQCFFTKSLWEDIDGQINYVVWNLKYDSGAVLYHLPQTCLHYFWETGEATHIVDDAPYKFKYVPHKLLRIKQGKRTVNFWDISQFYRSSLDDAAKLYLDEAKIVMTTKNFSPAYVKIHWKLLLKYCIRDANLTQRLGTFFVDKLEEFGITASSLYSSASISFKFFSSKSNIVTSWRFWNEDQKALALATDAYEGGKFEVTTRGAFSDAIEYDISSAYPHEIGNLIDITNATTLHTTEYQPKAVYGFLDCTITHKGTSHIPCGPMVGGVRIYPNGTFRQTITTLEYDYLLSLNVKVVVHDAVWFFVKRRTRPYRKAVDELFKLKSSFKDKDKMLYNVTKVVLNGFYGKMAQSIEQPDGSVMVGAGWNPVYASYITAATRIKVTQIQNLMGADCMAVHTDSVIVKRPLPASIPTDNALGNFGFVMQGSGILIACGMYQLAGHSAFKGFKAKKDETWVSVLSRYPRRKSIPYKFIHVESWLEAQAKNHATSKINVFEKAKKVMLLNCDKKRNWPRKVRAQDLLESQQTSKPKIFTME